VVLGLDPGFRTGCKVAVVDGSGKLLATATIYPHAPQNQQREALETLASLTQQHGVTLIAIGNGTASRETEQLAATFIRQAPQVRYVIVNEAGASVYSASPLARAELPDLDVSLRGAVSIARRVLDPLAELVKIDPKSIGVGLYQHDVDQKALGAALDGVVESVVNRVGVDVNTASPALLAHVAGIGPKLAEKIVAHRDANGLFASERTCAELPAWGPRLLSRRRLPAHPRRREPLDASAIHPESYAWRAGCSSAPVSPWPRRRPNASADLDALLADASGRPGRGVGRRRADIGRHLRTTGAPRSRPAHRPARADPAQRRALHGRPGAGPAAARARCATSSTSARSWTSASSRTGCSTAAGSPRGRGSTSAT
jgi:DNA uptake protein ComE-like DNA-binding protein